MNDQEPINVMVLLSGGVDSTTCIDYYVRKNYCVCALFINYNQRDLKEETVAASKVAELFKIRLNKISVSNIIVPEGYIPGRNLMLLSLALMNCPFDRGLIALGIHSGTSYQDCSPEFISLLQKTYSLYEEGRIRIDAPFLNWTKSEIIDYAKMIGTPLQLTFSTNPNEMPVNN